MLSLDQIIKTQKQRSAFGEGRHIHGHGSERIIPVPRDKNARPKIRKGRINVETEADS